MNEKMPQTTTKNPNWWSRRTTLERTLTVISISAAIAIVGLVLGLVSVILRNEDLHTSSWVSKEDICMTPECVYTASNILASMDPEISPCDDFYHFVCGNFIRTTNIPDDQSEVSLIYEMNNKLTMQLRELISEERHGDERKAFKLVNSFYTACMNKTLIEERGMEPINTIADSLGGWPVVVGGSWKESSWTWQGTIKKFRNLGLQTNYIFDCDIDVDLSNTTKWVIKLDQSSLRVTRENLVEGLDNKIVQAYYEYMVDVAVLFGADKKRAQAEMKESVQLEISLAINSLASEKRRNSSALNNPFTIADVQRKYPYVYWLDYINALLPNGLSVNEKEVIIVSVPSFFDQLGPLLKRTPKRVLANYLIWRIHEFSAFYLTEELSGRRFQYFNVIDGSDERPPRWKECVESTSDSLPIAVSALYVRKHFKNNAKSMALEMVYNIRTAFEKILSKVSWMDDHTRKSALQKLQKINTFIGYPDEIFDDSKLEEYYRDLEINPNMYLESGLRIDAFMIDMRFKKLRLRVDKTDWTFHAESAVVNAFYSTDENSMEFPAGILQGEMFSADRPKYMNYGAMGNVIGHEITHGFDDEGRQFDFRGNLVDWWRKDTLEKFLKGARCIIEQYGNYTDKLTGMNLNGINTQGENIADNGGMKLSYIAYNNWAVNHGTEQRLPGLNFSPQQMFWISAAHSTCSVSRPESQRQNILSDEHAPAEFRILGPLSNMDEFAKDFQCAKGTPMNPVHKCEVW